MYINLSLASKLARANAINTAIGANGVLQLYSFVPPLTGLGAGTAVIPTTPDYPPPAGSTLLAQLSLSPIAAVALISIQSMVINLAGSGGVDGSHLITGTTGLGTWFQASATILNGALLSIDMIIVAGAYTTAPTDITNEPVTGGGLIGATVSLMPTASLVFNPVAQTNGIISGSIGFARIATSALAGVIDLDVGVIGIPPAAALMMNFGSIYTDIPIVITADILIEG